MRRFGGRVCEEYGEVRALEGAGWKEPLEFLEDFGREVHHQDVGQRLERRRLVRSFYSFRKFFWFIVVMRTGKY